MTLFSPLANDKEIMPASLGFHVFVHNRSTDLTYFEGFDVSMGQQTNVAFKREVSTKIPQPHSKCVLDIGSVNSIFTKLFLQNNLIYKQKYCYNYCYQRKVIDQCGCYDVTFPRFTLGKPPCLSAVKIFCHLSLYNSFFDTEFIKNCTEECPGEKILFFFN